MVLVGVVAKLDGKVIFSADGVVDDDELSLEEEPPPKKPPKAIVLIRSSIDGLMEISITFA